MNPKRFLTTQMALCARHRTCRLLLWSLFFKAAKRNGKGYSMALHPQRTCYKATTPFLPRFGLTVASTLPLVSAPLRNACFSAAANAWLAAISCSRSAAESTGTIGGPDLLWWSYRKTLRLLISFRLPEPSCGRC
jgi:hypothetical protein